MADETQPNVGEVRTAGGETRRWNGHGWERVPRTFLGSEDFAGRMKSYAGTVVPTMLKDYAQPVLHPIDTIGGLISGVGHTAGQVAEGIKHPLTPQPDLGMLSDAGHAIRAAVQGDPEAAGHVLAAVSAPKVYDKALGGVNTAAHAVAENPSARSAAGYALGAGGSIATGIGHPFMGAVVGRMASSLLEKPAAELASLTDRIRNAIHGPVEGAAPAVDSELLSQYEALKKQYGQLTADNWLKRQQKPSPTATKPSAPSKAVGATQSSPSGAKAPTGTPDAPGSYSGGPRMFDQGPPSTTKPGPDRGQPVMESKPPAERIVNDATGETESQWRQRMQDRINRAGDASKGAKNPTAPRSAKTSASTGRVPEAPADMQASVDRMAGGADAPSKGNGTYAQPYEARGTAKPAFNATDTRIFQQIKSREMSPMDPKATESLQKLRDSIGAERAAKTLNVPVDVLRGSKTAEAAAPGPSQLPTTVRTRIALDVAKLKTVEDAAAYLSRAKDAKAIAYIQGLYEKFGIPTK